tara:strand:- start:78 stop:296 length:219 start_codon:yes stop_codon:yes gene_type:complete
LSTLNKIEQALTALGIEEYVVRADALIDTEEKFNNAFKKITGKDEHDNAIENSDPSKFGVTWTQVKAEMDKL